MGRSALSFGSGLPPGAKEIPFEEREFGIGEYAVPVPKPHPYFDQYKVLFNPAVGICKIIAIGRLNRGDAYWDGYSDRDLVFGNPYEDPTYRGKGIGKDQYADLRSVLIRKYGKGAFKNPAPHKGSSWIRLPRYLGNETDYNSVSGIGLLLEIKKEPPETRLWLEYSSHHFKESYNLAGTADHMFERLNTGDPGVDGCRANELL